MNECCYQSRDIVFCPNCTKCEDCELIAEKDVEIERLINELAIVKVGKDAQITTLEHKLNAHKVLVRHYRNKLGDSAEESF